MIFRIRKSTYQRLHKLKNGVLSQVLRHILSHDPIAPVLWEPHYKALDRRLVYLLTVIGECIAEYGAEQVLKEDYWVFAVNGGNSNTLVKGIPVTKFMNIKSKVKVY